MAHADQVPHAAVEELVVEQLNPPAETAAEVHLVAEIQPAVQVNDVWCRWCC